MSRLRNVSAQVVILGFAKFDATDPRKVERSDFTIGIGQVVEAVPQHWEKHPMWKALTAKPVKDEEGRIISQGALQPDA